MSKQERIQTAISAACKVINEHDIPKEDVTLALKFVGMLVEQEEE